MKVWLVLMCLISSVAYAKTTDIRIDLASLKSRDVMLESSTSELCQRLGAEGCNIFKANCSDNPLPNTCFQRGFLFYAMDIQVCGETEVDNCTKDRTQYEKKLQKFVKDYASSPGVGRAALNACTPFFEVVPESEILLEIQKGINSVMQGIGKYMSNKDYYECVKGQYLKILNN